MIRTVKYICLALALLAGGLYIAGGGWWSKRAALDLPEQLILAHRGVVSKAPQNSAPALRYAGELLASDQIQGVELDARLSTDGIPYLFHDEVIQLPNNPKAVRDLSYSQLVAHPQDTSGNRVISLDSALRLLPGNCWIYLDMKDHGRKDIAAYLRVIKGHNAMGRVLLASGKAESLLYAKWQEPNCLTLLEGMGQGKLWHRVLFPSKWEPDVYAANIQDISQEHMDNIRKKGLAGRFIVYGMEGNGQPWIDSLQLPQYLLDY